MARTQIGTQYTTTNVNDTAHKSQSKNTNHKRIKSGTNIIKSKHRD